MSSFTLTKQSNDTFLVTGDLTFFSIDKKMTGSFEFLNSAAKLQVDLAGVVLADSAGLALIIEWIKYSKLYNTQLKFNNMPQQILTIALLSDFNLEHYIENNN